MIWLFLSACGLFSTDHFSKEQVFYERYQFAEQLVETKQYTEAIAELDSLWKDTQSRAILERLADVHRITGENDGGLAYLSPYLQRHPGDFELRLMRAKLLLGAERWAEAKDDLQIILFNKKLSVWTLMLDPDLKPYRQRSELKEILGVPQIQIQSVSQPEGGLVGDTLLLGLKFSHVRYCEPILLHSPRSTILQVQRIQLDSQTIDPWIKETRLQLNWLAVDDGVVADSELLFSCGEDQLRVPLTAMRVEELMPTKRETPPSRSLVILPTQTECSSEEKSLDKEHISVQFRKNGLLERECSVRAD